MTTFADLLGRLLAEPTPAAVDAVRQAVLADPGFDREMFLHQRAREFAEAGDLPGLMEWLGSLMPGACLSPMAHRLLSAGHQSLGNQAAAEREASLMKASLDAILTSGDGTVDSPRLVLRTGDEYDALEFLGKTSAQVKSLDVGGRLVDEHTCDDGSVTCFAFVA